MELPPEAVDDLTRRLRRVEGQVRGLQGMLAEGRECREVVTQLSAATRALEQVGFRLLATGLAACLDDPAGAAADGDSVDQFERLFLKLA
jgi:DNA-binding FrmR family transcriptional regulator